jgi:hypothetical protein
MLAYRPKHGSQRGKFWHSRRWTGAAVGAAVLLMPALATATEGYWSSDTDVSLHEDHYGQIQLNERANLHCNGHSIYPPTTTPTFTNCKDETGADRTCAVVANANPINKELDRQVQIHNCIIHSQGNFDYGLSIADSWQFQLFGVAAFGANRANVHLRDSDTFSIEYGAYSDGYRGVEMIRASGSVMGTYVSGNTDAGIYQHDSNGNEYEQNSFIDNGGPGLYISHSTNISIVDAWADFNWAGIQVSNSDHFSIEWSSFARNDLGIRVVASGHGTIAHNSSSTSIVYDAWQSVNKISATNHWSTTNRFETLRNITLR